MSVRWGDVLLAVGALATLGLLSWSTGGDWVIVFAVLPCVLLVVRRTHPVPSAVGVYLLALVQFLVLDTVLPVNLLVPFALYTVTAHGPRAAGIAGLAGGWVGAVMFGWAFSQHLSPELGTTIAYAFPAGLLVTIAWALGLVQRTREERMEAIRERARILEQERGRESELAAAAERARIAREMHDIVAHSLAVIIAQADGGRYAARQDPEAGERVLTTIADLGRDALADIRRILGVLRHDDPDTDEVRPQPTQEDLGEVIERVRATGASVAWSRIGEPRPLVPGMGLTLQRVCQEALTNSLKHAGEGARMAVLLQWFEDRVVLQVDDDGRGAAAISDGSGSGLLGMRERAALFGGQVVAGPKRGGGYRVTLTLPLPPRSEETP